MTRLLWIIFTKRKQAKHIFMIWRQRANGHRHRQYDQMRFLERQTMHYDADLIKICSLWPSEWWDMTTVQWRHNERDAVSNTGASIVYSKVCWGADQRKHQSSTSLAREGNPPFTGEFPSQRPVMRKMFPFDDVIKAQVMTWYRTGYNPSDESNIAQVMQTQICIYEYIITIHAE